MKVELIDSMGSDLSVVNAARVSFDKESDWERPHWMPVADGVEPAIKLKEADKRLIQFLARGMTTDDFNDFLEEIGDHVMDFCMGIGSGDKEVLDRVIELLWQWRRSPTHFTPFAHPHVSFRCKAPIFLARQLEKHQVGFVWSEVSRRYVDSDPEFYVPEVWRRRAVDKKQGSSDEAVDLKLTGHMGFGVGPKEAIEFCTILYNDMLRQGVCPEQARMVLPQSMITEWVWTGSLYGWANVYNQRKPGSHAQRDVWPFAESLAEHMTRLFPVSWEALTQ